MLIDVPVAKQLEINNWTRSNGIKFISTDIRGLFGSVFTDFGDFVVTDQTGEEPLTGIIAGVSQETCSGDVSG